MDDHVSVAIIGGGPAGLSAAISVKENGVDDVVIYERDQELGGILNQCIHNGFGLHTFHEELTGPEYAARYIKMVQDQGIHYETGSMVISITSDKVITVVNKTKGLRRIKADSIILAMGCRERPRGALNIPGTRPQGIYTAGTAQRLVNCEGYIPGKEVVILGSGDIGLIMARRMTLEGANVKAVLELMPYSGGLKRNIVQCLNDYNIPLKLRHTIVNIHGKRTLSGVTTAKVDDYGDPIQGTEEYIACDTLLLSCGLIPENELTKGAGIKLNSMTNGPIVDDLMETESDGIFACGNVLHVHDLVDYVVDEARWAGKNAASYVSMNGHDTKSSFVKVEVGHGIRYTVPSTIQMNDDEADVSIKFRVNDIYKQPVIQAISGGDIIQMKKKRISVPSEMEELKIKKYMIKKDITILIAGEQNAK